MTIGKKDLRVGGTDAGSGAAAGPGTGEKVMASVADKAARTSRSSGQQPARPRSLYAQERRSAILAMLEESPSVQVAQIADAFGVSKVTARGDLDALEKAGKLRRTHGGAVSLSRTLTISIQDARVNVNAEAKRAIGRRAATFVENGDSILVDSGTTALEFVRELSGKSGITIVTDDFTIADFVDRSMPAADVVVLGGNLRKGHRYATGPLAMGALSQLHPDKAFVVPTAVVAGRGLMTDYQGMAELKQAFLHCASETFVLFDATKIGGSGLLRFGSLDEADAVVCDADPEGLLAEELEKSGSACQLILADSAS